MKGLNKIVFIGFLAGFLFTTGSWGYPQKIKFPGSVNFVQIPFKQLDGVIYFPVQIGDSKKYNFVLDTGATEISAIEEGLINSLSIKTYGEIGLKGAGKKERRSSYIKNITLNFGGIRCTNFRMASLNLKSMEAHWGKPKYGVIGGNILSNMVTQVNYDNNLLVFHKPGCLEYQGGETVIPLKIIDNHLLINLKIFSTGSKKGNDGVFVLDTAVRISFINTPFVNRYGLMKGNQKKIRTVTGYGIGGPSVGLLSRIHALKIGKYSFSQPVVQLCTEKRGIEASTWFDGIIGADFLSRFNLIIDYRNKLLLIKPNKTFLQPFVFDKSGLTIVQPMAYPGQFKVIHVVTNSPACRAGIKKGDFLTPLNEPLAEGLTLEQIRNRLKGEEGRQINLSVLRDGRLSLISFKLKSYL